jgi:hypothetical protein
VYIHAMEFYSAVKGNEISEPKMTWRNSKWKKSVWNDYILYDSVYEIPEKESHTVIICVVGREGIMSKWNTCDFKDNKMYHGR